MNIDLDVLMFRAGKHLPWLAIRTDGEASAAMYHVYSGFFWSLLSVALSRFSPWFLALAGAWAVSVFVRELWFERHQQPIKTRTDIITKLVGLVALSIVLF